MPSRYKILILLFIVTLAVGTLALLHSTHDNDALLHFRALFANRTFYNLKPNLTLTTDGTSLWYGGISLLAIIMIVLAIKAARRDGSQGLRRRFTQRKWFKAQTAQLQTKTTLPVKTDVESGLREELKAMTDFLRAKDSIMSELEETLSAKQQLLQRRNEELDALKSKVKSLTEQLADLRLAKERAENILEREIEKTKILQADSIIMEQDSSLSRKIVVLESQLREKQELLQSRNRELKASRSKVNTLRERLVTLGSAKKQIETVLQQRLHNKTELLQSKDVAMKELQESLSTRAQALETQLREKEQLLKERAAESAALEPEAKGLTESDPARERAKSLLLQELQNRAELLQAKDAIVKELEERLNTTAQALADARSEMERLVTQRDGKLAAIGDQLTKIELPREQPEGLLRPDRKGMNSQLLELGAAKARTASIPAEEAKPATETHDMPGQAQHERKDQE
jgi:chromosome segregation ATPase